MIGQTVTLDYNLASMTATKVVWQSNKMKTSYPLRVQAIRSHGQNPRLYVSFPLALAAAIGLEAGEEVEWELLNRGELHLRRPNPPAPAAKIRPAK
jgi:hypothetical protein